jgi:putative methyltransferase (TIGR04325 family)
LRVSFHVKRLLNRPELRGLLRAITPPFVVRTVRRWRQGPVWEGVYAHRKDVPASSDDYDDEQRIREMVDHASRALADLQAGRRPTMWHDMLAIAAALASAKSATVRVLDFGGGVGSGFIQLQACLPVATRLEYHVVELPMMCEAGRRLFAGDPRIAFHTSLEHVPRGCDIVYANSVVQYIDGYSEQLRRLAAVGAPWLVLARFATGNFPTYATQQRNLPGLRLGYWFLNQAEVTALLQGCGYRLIFDGRADRDYDQSNFPEKYRVGRMRNLIFGRTAVPRE